MADWGFLFEQYDYLLSMEILAIIGIIALALIIFTGGGHFGWVLKGIGAIFEFLLEGWSHCLGIIFWIIIIFIALIVLAS